MNLKTAITRRSARIGVIGLGYVGLPLAVEFAMKGFRTTGIDTAREKVDALTKGKNYIKDVDSKILRKVIKKKLLNITTDYSIAADLDIIFICVPTPFTPNKEPDITYIIKAAEEIGQRLRRDQLIVLKSTTFPNTTEGIVLPILGRSGLKVGKDFFLAFSPERIDPGNKHWHTGNTPVVVGGVTPRCTELTALISKQIVSEVISVSNPKVAEMEKLLENIFRSVNIALVNEMAQLCDRMGGMNIWEVIDAASTKPFGFMPFYPGPGIGGHCILVDPYYLAWQARQFDFQTNFITLAAETNESMPFYVKNMILREISLQPKSFRKARILFLGVAFKRDVDDIRHSPALKIMELLEQDGAKNLRYHDSYVPVVRVNSRSYTSVKLTKKEISDADCVVITTDHSSFDYSMIVRNAKCVVDTRNATKKVSHGREKIVVLGDGQ